MAERPSAFTPGERGATLTHYDQDPRIFELFLGRWMKYSPGIFTAPEDLDLDAAQERKMRFIAEQLGLRGGEDVLDVGCGWGSLVLFLAEKLGCKCVGVTPSPRQAEIVAERAKERGIADRVRVELGHVQEISLPRRAFDGITFVGSIVHMDDKSAILGDCYRALRAGGRLYVSETCFRNRAQQEQFLKTASVGYIRETFGWGDMAPLSVLISAVEDAGLAVAGVTDLTHNYKLTIDRWMAGIQQRRAEMDAIDGGAAERLLRYLEIANAGWGFTTRQYAITAVKKRL